MNMKDKCVVSWIPQYVYESCVCMMSMQSVAVACCWFIFVFIFIWWRTSMQTLETVETVETKVIFYFLLDYAIIFYSKP